MKVITICYEECKSILLVVELDRIKYRLTNNIRKYALQTVLNDYNGAITNIYCSRSI